MRNADIYRYVEEEGYYKTVKKEIFKKEISDWCEEVEVPELDKEGKETGKLIRPLNNPFNRRGSSGLTSSISAAWRRMQFNPPGHINTTDGVVVIDIIDSKVTVEI